jgi:plasmid stabilization system protein ParE
VTSATYRIVLWPEAENDVAEAATWYESRRNRPGLGREFLEEFRTTTAKLSREPLLNQYVFPPVRRTLLRRFPYGVFYEVVGREIVILACFHTSRDPDLLVQRLRRN